MTIEISRWVLLHEKFPVSRLPSFLHNEIYRAGEMTSIPGIVFVDAVLNVGVHEVEVGGQKAFAAGPQIKAVRARWRVLHHQRCDMTWHWHIVEGLNLNRSTELAVKMRSWLQDWPSPSSRGEAPNP